MLRSKLISNIEEHYDDPDAMTEEFLSTLKKGNSKLIMTLVGALVGCMAMLPLALSTLYRRFQSDNADPLKLPPSI